MARRINESRFLDEVGVTGLNQYAGYLFEEFLPQLRTSRRMAIYKEMRWNDPTIGAAFFAMELLARRATWRFDALGSETADEVTRDYLNSCMSDMESPWIDFISEAMSMAPMGFSLHDIVLKSRRGDTTDAALSSKYDDGLIGIRKLAPRSQDTIDRWEFDPNGKLLGAWQIAPPNFQTTFLPIEKLLHLRTMSNKDNPEGFAFLRNMFRPWYMKKRIENLEAIGVERDLAGIPVLRIPAEYLLPTATAEQKSVAEAYKRIGDNLRNDEQVSLLLPSDKDDKGNRMYDMELLQGASRRQFATGDIIKRYSVDIAQCVMADFMQVGHGDTGSFALSSDKTRLFALAVGTLLDIIAEGFTRKIVPILLSLNPSLKPTAPVKLTHGDIEDEDLKGIGEYVKSLTAAGIDVTDEPTESHLREIGGLPPTPAPSVE